MQTWLPHHILNEMTIKFLIGLFVLLVSWFVLQWLQTPLRKLLKTYLEPASCMMVIRIFRSFMFVLIGITVLASVGIDMKALVTGLGVTGISVGLACKDMLSNFVAGLILVVHRPFKINDLIEIKDFHGKVLAINLRYTVLQADGGRHLIPNTLFLTTPVVVRDA